MVKKTMTILDRFHLIPERHEQTDGRTDRQNCYINVGRQSRLSVLTRDKK